MEPQPSPPPPSPFQSFVLDFLSSFFAAEKFDSYLDLLPIQTPDAVQEAERHGLEAAALEEALPHAAHLLPLAVLGPVIDGELVGDLLDIDKAGADEGPLVLFGAAQAAADGLRARHEVVNQPLQRPVRRHRPVVAQHRRLQLLCLEPASRFQVLERLPRAVPLEVLPHPRCQPHVYVVQWVRERPVLKPVLPSRSQERSQPSVCFIFIFI